MKTDRLTKTFLAAIAMGLWMNALNPWIWSQSASADVDSDISWILATVTSIQGDLGKIESGNCLNSKLC